MMRTPDEIKKGLECCASIANCADGCPYHVIVEGSFGCEEMGCEDGLLPDALAYIQQLERERDFLLKYLTDSHWAACDICKHEPESHDINDCAHIRKVDLPCFEWRGLSEV